MAKLQSLCIPQLDLRYDGISDYIIYIVQDWLYCQCWICRQKNFEKWQIPVYFWQELHVELVSALQLIKLTKWNRYRETETTLVLSSALLVTTASHHFQWIHISVLPCFVAHFFHKFVSMPSAILAGLLQEDRLRYWRCRLAGRSYHHCSESEVCCKTEHQWLQRHVSADRVTLRLAWNPVPVSMCCCLQQRE